MAQAVFSFADSSDFDTSAAILPRQGYWRTVQRRLLSDYLTLFFLTIIILLFLAAIFAPWLAPFDPNKTSMIYRLKPMGYRQFLLGTDELGRDMLSRLLYGARLSLMMGLVPVAFATCTPRRFLRRPGRLSRRLGQHACGSCACNQRISSMPSRRSSWRWRSPAPWAAESPTAYWR